MTAKTKGELTKDRIVETAASLFLKNGYCNTGISFILQETKLPKGSFYFHFDSKKSLGMAVAEYFKTEYSQWFLRLVHNTTDWNGFVTELAKEISEKIEHGDYYGCPFSCFGTEASAVDTDIAHICTQAIQEFAVIFASAFYRKQDISKEELKKATAALCMYEGYLVSYRICGSSAIIEAMKQSLIALGGI